MVWWDITCEIYSEFIFKHIGTVLIDRISNTML